MLAGAAWYAIAVAVLMAGWWTVDLRAGALDRPDRTRAEIGLHLAAELTSAAVLAVGGVLALGRGATGLLLVGLGMLLYTVIQSPGYFVARREFAPAVMFAVLIAGTSLAIAIVLTA
jgi:hypothetical protein